MMVLGRTGAVLFGIGIVSSFILSVIEYCIAIFLMLFLVTLGFVNPSQLPSWLPLKILTFSPFSIWGGLFLVIVVRAAGEIITYQSKIMLTEIVHARMRMILGYQLLMQETRLYVMPLSQINLYMAELFPRATSFIFYCSQFITFCIQMIMISGGMLFLARNEAMIGIAGLCVMGYAVIRFNRLTNKISQRVPEAQARIEQSKIRVVRNWLLIKVLRLQDKEYENYLKSVSLYYKNSVAAYFFGNLGGSLLPILGVVLIAIVVLMSFHIFKTPAVNLAAFLYLFVQFQQRVANGSNLIGGLFTYRVQFRDSVNLFSSLPPADLEKAIRPEKMFSLLKGNLNLDTLSGSKKTDEKILAGIVETSPPSVALRNVTFSWPTMGKPVFEDLCLDIAEGSQFGIVGPNGSGKSTLLTLILGILRPSNGQVFLGGIKADEYVKHNHESIGYVGAEPYLIHGTIRENITYGLKGRVSEDDILKALRVVKLDDFVAGIPNGLEYMIEENGEGLSAGQKQRLTLARAFFRKPSLLVLDEPSANLDSASEAVVINALENLRGLCTMIIVSHKPEVLRGADSVFDMGSLQTLQTAGETTFRSIPDEA
jgi:ABC-type multidrug transport system fused ATPase/permease subunit